MDELQYTKILKLFQYSSEDRETFSFINDYMENINTWLGDHQFTDEQLLRYMIVGFFLEFEVICYHQSNFTTDPKKWSYLDERPQLKEKLVVFNKYCGKIISSTNEYATLLGLTDNVTFKKFMQGTLDEDSKEVQEAVKQYDDRYQRLHEGALYHYVINGWY